MNSVPPPGIPGAAQPKTSSQAVWSLVLGILSNTCLWLLCSIPAIILGVLALKNIDKAPQQLGGRGLAIAGIITGASGVLIGMIMLAIVASLATPAFTSMNRNAKLTKQSSDIRQLILACKAYAADDAEGKFPPNLEVLVQEGYLDSEELLMTQDFKTRQPVPFTYQAGHVDDGSKTPLILGPTVALGSSWERRVIGYSDGSVSAVRESESGETVELERFKD